MVNSPSSTHCKLTQNSSRILPPAPSPPPRSQTTQSTHQPRRTAQTGRLWSRTRLWHSRSQLHPRSRHPLVSRTRRPPRLAQVLDSRRYLECRLHLCGNGQWSATRRWDFGNGSAGSDLSLVGDTDAQHVPGDGRSARVFARFAAVSATSRRFGIVGTVTGWARVGSVIQDAAIRSGATNHGAQGTRSSVL